MSEISSVAPDAATRAVAQMVRAATGLPEGFPVVVREEPHCPDASCPLRRTVLEWNTPGGGSLRAIIVKPLVYVRVPDVERAVRTASRLAERDCPPPGGGGKLPGVIIYPAIDLKNGRCVRLAQGRAENETVYHDDPTVPAREFLAAGAAWVHVVDLDGAFTGQPRNLAQVARIAATGLHVQLGGGLRTLDAVEEAFHAGVRRVVIGTRACQEPEFVAGLVRRFGGERLAVGIDARDGHVAVKGWVDISTTRAEDLARRVADLGVGTIIHTDIATDGMLTGPNFAAQEEMLRAVPVRVIASGGVATRADVARFVELARAHPNLDGVIVGKAIYEKKVELADLLALAAASP